MRCLLLLLPLVINAQETSSAASKASKSHTGPFSAFTKSLPQEKKKPFMELMKRLRTAKAATVGTKEEKKRVLQTVDADIHKLLGTDYKRYRTVQHLTKELHAAKKSPSTSSLAAPLGAAAP